MLVLLFCAACNYDWTVAPDQPVEVPVQDDPPLLEAGADAPAVPPEGSRTCADVTADLPAARAAAKACPTLTASCTFNLTDECGCHTFLWADSAAAVTRYQALVAELGALGCKAAGCTCLAASEGRCLAAGGDAYACSP
jgi:hypothetical protein